VYIELTTLKQALVTRKNRKIRRLRQLYPHVNLRVFYGRDFRNLLLKYGLRPPQAPGPRPSSS
jgi:hypoxanthine phosphoribosyltransferase